MRTLKFRAWDLRTSRMLGHDYLLNYKSVFKTYGDTGRLMQFTGLRDSKRTDEYPEGQEIYEGDICKYSYLSPLDGKVKLYVWVVGYTNGMYWLRHIKGLRKFDSALYLRYDQIEVIGNEFENPELLEVESNC